VSIVVATHNREHLLKEILPTYVSQPGVAETVVVDDGGQDGTQVVCEGFGDTVRYLRNEVRRGQSHAMNVGVRAASGEFVFIGEDDLKLDENHIPTLLDHLDRSKADIICGRRVNVYEGQTEEEALERAARRRDPLINRRDILEHSFVEWDEDRVVPLTGPSMLIRRQVFEDVLYDETIKGRSGWRLETDFQLAAGSLGYKLVLCPHTVGFHYPSIRVKKKAGGAKSGSRQGYEYEVAGYNLRLLRKHWGYLSDPAGPFGLGPTPAVVFARQMAFRYLLGARKTYAFARARFTGRPPAWH
jgi:GT2 family glycosyltransferase